MKKNIRAVSYILAVLMAVPFTACANSAEETIGADTGNNRPAETTEAENEETVDPMLLDDLPESDFGGYNFRILSCEFVGRELASFLMADEMNGDAVNDTLYNNTREVEDRFNVDISYYSVADYEILQTTVKNAVIGGTDDFDIQCGHDYCTASLATEGMFVNLYDIEQFNFDKPWWPKNIISQLDVAGKLFLGSNYLTFNGLHWTRVLIANKDRFDELQIEIPYDDINNGTWYFDDMYALCASASKDLDGDGKMGDKDLYGFALGNGVTYCLQDTFNMVFYEETEDGLLVNPDEGRIDTIIDGVRKLLNDETITYLGSGGDEFCIDIFLDNRSVLATTMIGTAYDSFRDAKSRFTILPFPKYDELQDEYINTCTDAFWAIPITASEHLDVIGSVIEALSCVNYQRVLPIYYETAIKTKLSDSPDDAAMFDIIKDSRTIGFEYAYQMEFANITERLVLQNDTAFTTYYASRQKSAQKKADKFFEKMKELHN